MADVIRVIEQVGRFGSGTIADDVTVLGGNALEKLERIAHHLAQVATPRRGRQAAVLGGIVCV